MLQRQMQIQKHTLKCVLMKMLRSERKLMEKSVNVNKNFISRELVQWEV